jgi:hypothetical protein
MSEQPKNQQRTAIIYFGPTQQDYQHLVEAEKRPAFIDFIQSPLQQQLGRELHRHDCACTSHYTVHQWRERTLEGWFGQVETFNIARVRCGGCGTVFTVLPSFILRYRRQDTDCLSKVLTLSMQMGLSQRHTALVYSWSGANRVWSPGWVWNLIQWLGTLLPLALLLVRLGLTAPLHVLSDEKFARLDGKRIYLFMVSQGELIWHIEWLSNLNEASFEPAIGRFLSSVEQSRQMHCEAEPESNYGPQTVNTDGWRPAQNAWKSKVPSIKLSECLLHGHKRIDSTLTAYFAVHPEMSPQQQKQLKHEFDHVLDAPSLAAYSQRVRRLGEAYPDEELLQARLEILKDKRFLFTNHLQFPEASAVSAPLDRSMRFLDEKLQIFGQFRVGDKINATLNAWAIVNNLRAFLPDAQKAGQSLVEAFGAKLRGIPWMEALNLCTVGCLDKLVPASG